MDRRLTLPCCGPFGEWSGIRDCSSTEPTLRVSVVSGRSQGTPCFRHAGLELGVRSIGCLQLGLLPLPKSASDDHVRGNAAINFVCYEPSDQGPHRRLLMGESMGGLNVPVAGLSYPSKFAKVATLCPGVYASSPFGRSPTFRLRWRAPAPIPSSRWGSS